MFELNLGLHASDASDASAASPLGGINEIGLDGLWAGYL